MRFVKWLLRGLLRLLYRVDCQGLEHYHDAGERVLIVANHTSLLDGLLLYAWLPDTPTFAINSNIARQPRFGFFLRFVNLFRMDPASPLSLKSLIRYLNAGNKAVIFPEGRVTTTGGLMKIYEGPGLVADKADAMVLPIGIHGPQFSPFSYLKGKGVCRWFPRVTLRILPPRRIHIDASLQGPARRKSAVQQMQDVMYELHAATFNQRQTVFQAMVNAARDNGPKRIILEDSQRQRLSYRQLLQRALILGSALRRQTDAGEHVGLMLPNSNAMAIGFLALQYSGRIAAMINFTGGARSVIRACETGNVKRIYTSRQFIEKAGLENVVEQVAASVDVRYLEDLRAEIGLVDKLLGLLRSRYASRHYRRITRNRDPDQPAVILFTSGSEGVPKGVVLSHANLLANYAQVRCHIDFQPTDLVFNCLPLFHSFGLNAGFIMPLLGGSQVFLYPTPLHYRQIPELIYELGATILYGTNTFFKGYAHYAHPFDFHSLRYTVAGAEKLRDDTLQLWMERFGIRILQGYGVTETSPVIAVNTPLENRIGTVGRPVTGMQFYLAPVDGIETGGRLVVSGPNVMLGYLLADRPGELVPPETERGRGWYDTGDIASIDDDGYITILGRAKRFAKVGGEMVSLTAVEELAQKVWPDASHSAVSLTDEHKGEKILLLTTEPDAHRKALIEYARQHGYGDLYVPRHIIGISEIPVLGTGKTDYSTLQQLAEAADASDVSWIDNPEQLISNSKQQ
ncbi:acyl-[acyl-carrier-protein]-phospholipid O-acyltransferase/long-chain-fatty-acid--[acyl-carrier-protein] ligase [Methylohalomonas lacus]|uniref:Acyl-[acyl-carrier-protein]-phospholipid O-acyltransferase/long-chain-fatty-acid--[acyl-carrier-protein] ligase n=1 Tax=Methylohalomonas lacus TaxID=398773 RepID=A0AAE3L496_9GAMM|nr:AMP-binding protein [Methylohalomonas lacus]MCS3903518.1 acyl-[acyl-carrier-protein]-phospholipid O-acyltransferase/long-chain-fatty-acid--[acyl-carrier-protein] ligase [Methylohalomonas lacus]